MLNSKISAGAVRPEIELSTAVGVSKPSELREEPTLPSPIPMSLSVASTEATLMVIDSTLAPTSRKRSREEDDEAVSEEIGARPATRAKTETYEAPAGQAAGVWDRLIVPWRIFVQGFSEGFQGGQ